MRGEQKRFFLSNPPPPKILNCLADLKYWQVPPWQMLHSTTDVDSFLLDFCVVLHFLSVAVVTGRKQSKLLVWSWSLDLGIKFDKKSSLKIYSLCAWCSSLCVWCPVSLYLMSFIIYAMFFIVCNVLHYVWDVIQYVRGVLHYVSLYVYDAL